MRSLLIAMAACGSARNVGAQASDAAPAISAPPAHPNTDPGASGSETPAASVPSAAPSKPASAAPVANASPEAPGLTSVRTDSAATSTAERVSVGATEEEGSVIAYDPSQPVPNGYVLHQGRKKGLIISGSIVFGVGYGLSLLGAAPSDRAKDIDSGWLVLPVAGPLIAMLTQTETCDVAYGGGASCGKDASTRFVLATLFTMQAVGATLFTWGVFSKRQWLERRQMSTVSIYPALVGRDGYGVSARATF